MSLYAGETAAFGVLFVAVFLLYAVQRTAKSANEQAADADRVAGANGSATE